MSYLKSLRSHLFCHAHLKLNLCTIIQIFLLFLFFPFEPLLVFCQPFSLSFWQHWFILLHTLAATFLLICRQSFYFLISFTTVLKSRFVIMQHPHVRTVHACKGFFTACKTFLRFILISDTKLPTWSRLISLLTCRCRFPCFLLGTKSRPMLLFE